MGRNREVKTQQQAEGKLWMVRSHTNTIPSNTLVHQSVNSQVLDHGTLYPNDASIPTPELFARHKTVNGAHCQAEKNRRQHNESWALGHAVVEHTATIRRTPRHRSNKGSNGGSGGSGGGLAAMLLLLTLMYPCESIRRFSGFKSRYMRSKEWRYSKARTIWAA